MNTMLLSRQDELSNQIELVRERMNMLGCEKGLLHPDVMKCSEHLDKLLIVHYEIEEHRKGRL